MDEQDRRSANVVNTVEEIPEFLSDAEEVAFWETHSLGPGMLETMQAPPAGLLPTPRPRRIQQKPRAG